MTSKIYNLITNLCLVVAVLSAVSYPQASEESQPFIIMYGLAAAIVALVTYFINIWLHPDRLKD